MKVIIAGGRDYVPTIEARVWLRNKLVEIKADEIVSGGYRGADAFGIEMAEILRLPVKLFIAQWENGKSAGPIRNKAMSVYADACILFPGGRGTANMKYNAIEKGLPIYEYSESLNG